nr:small heat shock protein [Ailoscolex lacteospumosus]
MALVMRDFPVMRYEFDFFERIKQQMNLEFKQIEEEIDKMRKQMLHLLPMDPIDVTVQEIKPAVPIVEEKGETKLKLEFNVKEFRPEDLEVKLLGNNILQVTAHREDKTESGMSKICYLRKYSLPEGIDKDHIKPTLTKDGVLTIEAPAPALKPKERMIPIEYKVQ